MPTPFRVDVILANGTNVGTSTNIIDLNTTEKLDAIGQLSFTIPAADKLAPFIQTGVTFEVYDKVDGYLGTYLFCDKTINDKSGVALLKVNCYDVLKELTFQTVGFNRSYNNEYVNDVITDLISDVNSWSVLAQENFDTTTIDYQGENVFRAIDEQRDRNGAHFRLKRNTSRVLEFGTFGDYNGIVFTKLRGQTHIDSVNNDLGIIDTIELTEESDDVYNAIIPLGHGQGVSQLTIEGATLGDYPVLSELNSDGTSYYYFENENSILKYGRRERILSLPNMRPISNSDIDIINARNALKLIAEVYAAKHAEPKVTYTTTFSTIPSNLQVGDKIRLQYKGVVAGVQYIDVDDYYYVMDISKNRSADGTISFSLSITNIDDRRTSDQNLIVDVVRDLRSLNVHIPASITYSPIGPLTRRIKGSGFPINRVNAVFKARIREEVLYLNRAILHIATSPLKSSVTVTAGGGASTTTSAGGGDHGHIIGQLVNNTATPYTNRQITIAMGNNFSSPTIVNANWPINATVSGTITDNYIITATASGDHTHDIDLPAHTHAMIYDVYQDTIYPQLLGIIIDGEEYTDELLAQIGETQFAPSNNAYECELDITSILNLNLKTNHTIEIYADQGRGEIEAEIDCMVTIQPVRIN